MRRNGSCIAYPLSCGSPQSTHTQAQCPTICYVPPPQELYRWSAVADAGRRVLNQRMRLLPLFYTLLFNATQTGAPLFRPPFMAFPEDSTTHPIAT